MKRPYIGVTGVTKREETEVLLAAMPDDPTRDLMVGVLASMKKTLQGQENNRPNSYPAKERIADIFVDHHLAFNLIHYSTRFPENLCEQLLEMTRWGGPNLHGFQLNIAWPPASQLERYRASHPNMKIVLQIGGRALDVVGHYSQNLAAKIRNEYFGLFDYILLDVGRGRGATLDAEAVRGYLRVLKIRDIDDFVVAGGLGPDTLHLIKPLMEEFPDISINAEGRLRDEKDYLNVNSAIIYIRRALEIFGD